MDFWSLVPTLILIIVIFSLTMFVALYSTFAERKVAAFIQDRRGPNRAGPGGILQPLADGLKMFTKEEVIPVASNRFLFVLGPSVAMTAALMTSVVIPWGPDITLFGKTIPLQIANIDIGMLYVFAVVSVGVYGLMIGGWASNNKFSLIGAIRASSQVISYELSMGLSIIALLMMTGTLNLKEIVDQQHGWHWNVIYQPVSFLIFLICAFAETNRTPFDLPECETELVGGYHTEYSSMKLGFYLFSEYINMFVSSAVIVTLFFGGYNYPGMDSVNAAVGHFWGPLIGFGVFFAKICFFIFFYMWVRWTVSRFRYDQLMNLGWKGLIPLSILNVIVTAAGLLFFKY
jgi:NADH-quinone oxidoreductase subunit H